MQATNCNADCRQMAESSLSAFKLVVVGQTPPPFNGQAKMIEVMNRGLRKHFDFKFIRMDFSDSVSTAGKFSFGKITHLFLLIAKTCFALGFGRKKYLYYPPASPNLIPVLRDILFLMVVRPFCKGLILHFHAGGISRYAKGHPLQNKFLQLVYGRMCLGIVQGDSCPDDPGYFNAARCAVIPYGIDVNLGHFRPQEKSDSDAFKILYVGIHTADKGLFTLLETAKELRTHGIVFKVKTVGSWYTQEEESRFIALRTEYNLDEIVVCEGQKTGDELFAMYDWADVFLFPTKYPWETMGIVQLEAMAHALPIVASDWQGPKDVVEDGNTGYLCASDRPDLFAERLKLLSHRPDVLKNMGAAGLKRYQSFYTEEAFIERLVKALSQLSY